jgi:hypothetical protein
MPSSVPLIRSRQPSHALPIKLFSGDSRIYLSKMPRRIIFFVHGFGGKNTATWMNFPSLMLDDPQHASDDLLFYGYESLRQPARASAGLLYQNCDELFVNSASHETGDGPSLRNGATQYQRIVFVAHSLGAPVVRCMLNTAHAVRASWLNKVAVIFFAPATAGARADKLLREFGGDDSGTWFNRFYAIFRSQWPVIDDLKIRSPFLREVFSETDRLIQREGRQNFRSAKTLCGTEDRIINLEDELPYFDEPYDWLAGVDHIMICKPFLCTDDCYDKFARAVGGL